LAEFGIVGAKVVNGYPGEFPLGIEPLAQISIALEELGVVEDDGKGCDVQGFAPPLGGARWLALGGGEPVRDVGFDRMVDGVRFGKSVG